MYIEQRYFAPYLGEIGEDQYELFANFFEAGGLKKTVGRLPYFSDKPTTTDDIELLESQMSSKKTLYLPNDNPQYQLWKGFLGAFSEIFCETAVRSIDINPKGVIVSGEQIIESIAAISVNDQTRGVLPYSFAYFYNANADHSVSPDSLFIQTLPNGKAQVDTVYEYKSSFNPDMPKDFRYVEYLKRDVSRNREQRILLQEALGLILDLDPEDICIPYPNYLNNRLVVVQGNMLEDIQDQQFAFNKGVLRLGLPSIARAAHFVLKLLATSQENWQDNFTLVRERQKNTQQTPTQIPVLT
jgi:hypothetical protein